MPLISTQKSITLFVVLAFALAPLTLDAQTQIGEDDFRISNAGPDGSVEHDAAHEGVAFNSEADQYLVVWDADDRIPGGPPLFDGKHEIFGQLLDGDGSRIGAQVLVATSGDSGDPTRDASNPVAIYNSRSDHYLVVYVASVAATATAAKTEIFARRVSTNGAPIGNPIRISQTGIDSNLRRDSREPGVAFNANDNEYLIVWQSEESDQGSRVEHEIYAQRLNGSTALPVGPPVRVSTMGPNGSTAFDAFDPFVTFSNRMNEYLVVWRGDDDRGTLVEGEFEIFAQRLLANGTAIGEDDFRISQMGPAGDPSFRAEDPAVAYDEVADEYLVTWTGTDDQTLGEEVYAQLITGTGAVVRDDFRISDMGPAGNPAFNIDETVVAANPIDGEFLVVWIGEDNRNVLSVDEREVYAQRVLSTSGAEIGIDDARLSSMGPDGVSIYDVFSIEVVYNSNRNEYFVAWSGDDNRSPLVDDELEIFGQRLTPTTPQCEVDSTTLCLASGRFEVQVDWQTETEVGAGQATELTADTGAFWFFDPANVELVVKVLDARGINGSFWVFFGALSDVQYSLRVLDTQTGQQRAYDNTRGTFASVGDTGAFPQESSTFEMFPSAALAPPPGDPNRTLAGRDLQGSTAPCEATSTTLCLNDDRFRVEVAWTDRFGSGASGSGRPIPLTSDSGMFWFFDSANVELIIKVLDARAVNGRFWVFFGALSNVEFTITVTDTQTGAVRIYENPSGTFASRGDTDAFE